mgnify:CR=1 FL=1
MLLQSECPQVKTLHPAPEVPYRAARPRFPAPIECTLYIESALDTDNCSSGGFHTHLTGSPLFVGATSSHRHPRRSNDNDSTPTTLQSDSIQLLVLFIEETQVPSLHHGEVRVVAAKKLTVKVEISVSQEIQCYMFLEIFLESASTIMV